MSTENKLKIVFLKKIQDKLKNLQKDSKSTKLVHYSRKQGLEQLDPKFQGTGAPASEYKKDLPEVPSTYYYRHGAEPEDIVSQGAKSKYTVKLDPEKHELYDLAEDHKGHVKQAVENNMGIFNRDKVLGDIKDAGYHGWYNSKSALPNVVALFHPHPVHKEDKIL